MEKLLYRVLVVGVGAVLALLIAVLLILGGLPDSKSVIVIDAGAREAFEAHLAAMDAGDWQLADTFVKEECTVEFAAGANDPQKALDEMLASGFSFRRAFEVEEVWLLEDGDKALLGVDSTPADLPDVIELERIEGEWLVAC